MKHFKIIAAFFLIGALTCSAQDGKQIYSDKCAICHGPDGAAKTAKGKQLKVKSAAESLKLSMAELIKIVENGKGLDMPAYAKELAAGQIKAAAEYFRGLAK